MTTRKRVILFVAGLVVVAAIAAVIIVVAWPEGNKSAGCAPVAGSQLLVLQDDKGLQPVANLIPMVNPKAATPEVLAALDAVSAAVDTSKLSTLNRAVDIDRRPPQQVAADFAKTENLAAGIAKGPGGKIVIGTGDLAESQTMAELYGIALAAAGFAPEIRKVGDLEKTELAVERGEVQVAAESVDRLAELLNVRMHGHDTRQQGATSDMTTTMHNLKNFGETYGLVLGKPSEAADQTAFAVTKDFADKHGVRTLSELAAKCGGGQAVLGGPPECPKQSLCQQGLERTYGLTFGSFTALDAGGPMTKDALRTGKISVGQVRSADGDVARA